MPEIFVSYARVDLERVRPIVEALQAHGWVVWWDLTSLRTGQSFNKIIRQALSQVKCVLALWSETSAKSRWVEAEAYWAWEKEKLASVVLDGELTIPVPFNTTHAENLCDWGGDLSAPAFRKLIADLTALVGTPEANQGVKPNAAELMEQPAVKKTAASRSRKKHTVKEITTRGSAQAKISTSFSFVPPTVYRDKLKNGGEGPELVIIPGGVFLMGASVGEARSRDCEFPQHTVNIAQPFAMGRYPVTFEEYDQFWKTLKQRRPPSDKGWGRGRRPAINVSWRNAIKYCKWLREQTGKAYRLPSETEWEYACRAGTKTAYYWGDDPGKNRENVYGSGSQWSGKRTSPVGSFAPNPFRLYDMLGNVTEWCQDRWQENYQGAPTDGTAWLEVNYGSDDRVLRGGYWRGNRLNARSASRRSEDEVVRSDDIGFRVVCSL